MIHVLALTAALAAPTFTGDVAGDFDIAGAVRTPDPNGVDVGVPTALPPGTISGWDIDHIDLFYDAPTDTLYVGLAFYGICSDADGDGDPGRTSAGLAFLGGTDAPDLGPTESLAFFLDIDEDGTFDLITGVPATGGLSGFTAAAFDGSPFAPAFAFGAPQPAWTGVHSGSPSADRPDFELTIPRFSQIPTSSGADQAGTFAWSAFAGSFSDAGVGEDFFPGVGQTEVGEVPMCGDGVTCDGEACDDGNLIDGDGCSSTCTIEEHTGCTRPMDWYQDHSRYECRRHQQHPWPISEDTLLCGHTWRNLLHAPARGSKVVLLAQQWITANLNATQASTTAEVSAALSGGAALLADCRLTSAEVSAAVRITATLEAYNHGELGPCACESEHLICILGICL